MKDNDCNIITIDGINTGGKVVQFSVAQDATKIDLDGNQLQSIDLTPLASCTELQILFLSDNQLQNIDLTPLSSCTSLEKLHLSDNKLQSIDLAPLASCTKLWLIKIISNKLKSIDLTPLCFHHESQVHLFDNPLQSLEVTPLVKQYKLGGEIDHQLHSWLKTGFDEDYWYVFYYPPTLLYPWRFLSGVNRRFENKYQILHDTLIALGLGDYGFIDYDLSDIYDSIPWETNTEDAQEILTKTLVEKIVASVGRGGQTTGLNLEKVSSKHPEIAALVPKIIEIRTKEIQRITVPKRGSKFDLRELWVTAYGYDKLKTLDMKLETSSIKKFKQVKNAFAEIGLELKTGHSTVSGVETSNALKELIWWIVKNTGEPWEDIKHFTTETLVLSILVVAAPRKTSDCSGTVPLSSTLS